MTTTSRRRLAWLLLAFSGLSLVVAWAMASPVGASPDEPAQISYAWGTVTGQTVWREHLVTIPVDRTATRVLVPEKLLQYPEPGCYAYHPETPVRQCLPLPKDTTREVPQASYMSRYPPLFYGIEGAVLRAAVAVDLSGPRVLYVARLASGVLSWLTVALGVFLLARRFPARVVILATLLALPATTWFLVASVNPNGLEIAAAFLLAAGVLSMRVDSALGARSAVAVMAVPLGTVLLVWSRPLSWVWASLILGLLLVPNSQPESESWKRRLPLRRLGAAATTATVLVLASSMAWFVYALQIQSARKGLRLTPADNWAGLSHVGRPFVLLLHFGTMLSEQIGTFGWLDTPLPTIALFAWVSIAAVAAALWSAGGHTVVPRWCLIAVLGLGCLTAMVDEYREIWGWQGRYLLPVTAATCVLAVPGLTKGVERLMASRRLLPMMLVGLMAVNALSVVWFLFRNAYGVRPGPSRLPSVPLPVGNPTWTPPLGQGAVFVFVTLALVAGVYAVGTLRPEPVDANEVRQASLPLTDGPVEDLQAKPMTST